MPRDVIDLIDVVGNHARTEILRHLSGGPLSAMDLAAALEIHHASVHRHLVQLEAHGLVAASTDIEPGQRRGAKDVVWKAVSEQIEELARRWTSYAAGLPEPSASSSCDSARGES